MSAVLPATCRLHVTAPGKKPQRYDYIIPPSYARLVNFTERLWDYDSCAEAQLKIWLARHLLASECSGGAGKPRVQHPCATAMQPGTLQHAFVPTWCCKAAHICSAGWLPLSGIMLPARHA